MVAADDLAELIGRIGAHELIQQRLQRSIIRDYGVTNFFSAGKMPVDRDSAGLQRCAEAIGCDRIHKRRIYFAFQ